MSMTNDDMPKSVWSGSFTVFGVELKCHTLDNGQRIIEADSLAELMEKMGQSDMPVGDIDKFNYWKEGT